MTDQPTLPTFEGSPVTGSAVRITKAGDGLSEALDVLPSAMHLGEEVCYVLRGTIAQVNHRTIQGKVTRVHTVETTEIAELPVNIAEGLLTDAHEKLLKIRDKIVGQSRIEDEPPKEPGPEHTVTGDGVVETPADAVAAGSEEPQWS